MLIDRWILTARISRKQYFESYLYLAKVRKNPRRSSRITSNRTRRRGIKKFHETGQSTTFEVGRS